MVDASDEQSQNRLLRLVRLGQHGRAGLLQNAESGEIRALGGHIHIDDASVGCLKVHFVDRQEIASKAQSRLLGAIIGPEGCEVLDRCGNG